MQSCFKLILLLLCVTIYFVGGKQFRCDYTYIKAAEGWLKYHEMPSNWNEARLRCHMEGAVLASPLTLALKNAMTTLAKEKGIKCPLFTGIHSTFSRGVFASIEGVPLSKIPHVWGKNEPDNFKGEEDALVLLPDGTMGDSRSKDAFPYMCYKKKANLVVTGCGTTDPEYNLDTRTGSCYKFHKKARTWSRAYMNCMAEGSYLAIVNSDTESTILRDLFNKHPAGSLIGNFNKDEAFVGFHDWTEHGEWRTIQGQTLSEAGFDKFGLFQPNNNTGGQYCGAIQRTGQFDDMWCEMASTFICEKDPTSLTCDDN